MQKKALAGILLSVFLTGCATTNGGQHIQVQQLQNRIGYLESELQRKDREIKSLEEELERKEDKYISLNKQKMTGDKDAIMPKMSKKDIQRALKNAGFYNGPIDGIIGSKTKEALRAFQKSNGLKPDGIIGEKTSKKLSEYLGR